MSLKAGTWTHVSLLVLLFAASLYCNLTLVDTAKKVKAASRLRARRNHAEPQEAYSWVGTDFGSYLPVEAGPVKMVVEDTVHYPLTGREAYDEWLWTAPLVGDNDVRLGPEMRTFAVPMFHELHCLRWLRSTIELGLHNIRPGLQEHMHHCFVYLRQWTLCGADVTLEPGDFATRNFTVETQGGTHTCLDWEPVYRMVEGNWPVWDQYRIEHGLPEFTE